MSSSINSHKKVIIAPLNWGWGHVTRCIPIIKEIECLGLQPVLACDGDALLFLQKEFPHLDCLVLPSYKIKYKRFFKLGLLFSIPSILMAVYKEHQCVKNYVNDDRGVVGIISDNRLGVYVKNIKSIYITHQLSIKAGVFSLLMNKFHHYFIKKHSECWVPDEKGSVYTGELSLSKSIKPKYIGVLSRLEQKKLPKKYDLLVLLSGVEGQRGVLEELIRNQLKNYKGNVLLVRGSFKKTSKTYPNHVQVVDYLLSEALEKAINSSEMVLARCGYSTVMDLIKLNKKAFFIPTPGQSEQEYLGSYLAEKKIAFSSSQQKFKIEMLPHKKNINQDRIQFNADQYFLKKELRSFFRPFLV